MDPTKINLHQLPPPPELTGRRADLAELLAAHEKGNITIFGLWGMGGIGKTALALKFAEQLAHHYPDAQFYLDIKGSSSKPLSAIDGMVHVIRAYYPTVKLYENEAELRGLYQSVFHDKRALLLIDNAASAEQVAPLIPFTSCVLLITSRQQFTLPGLFAKKLDTLSPDDARTLLLRIAPRIGEWADTVAELCGYLPLALCLAGRILVERMDLNPIDYVQLLTDKETRLELINSSLGLSYELLKPELQKLWCMLVTFPETFDKFGAATLWDLELDSAHDTLSKLVIHGLVEWYQLRSTNKGGMVNEDETMGHYRLHELARLFAEAHLHESASKRE